MGPACRAPPPGGALTTRVVGQRADGGRVVVYHLTDEEVAGVLVRGGQGGELERAEQRLAAHEHPAG